MKPRPLNPIPLAQATADSARGARSIAGDAEFDGGSSMARRVAGRGPWVQDPVARTMPDARDRSDVAPVAGDRQGLGLCCIGRVDELAVPGGIEIGPEPSVRAIDEGPLRAVVIDMNAASLAHVAASDRQESIDWRVPCAERHGRIIAAVAAVVPVIPARFGCVFSGEDPLRAMLAEHESRLWNALEAVDGAAEYAIRILVDRERASDAMFTGEAIADEPSARRSHGVGRHLDAWLAERLRDPIGALQDVARAACRHRIGRTQEGGLEVIADWAFLVGNDDRERFEVLVAGEGLRWVASGRSSSAAARGLPTASPPRWPRHEVDWMRIDGMVKRSPVVVGFSRTFGSTCGWQDRASEATAPGAFHHSVVSSRLAAGTQV